MYLARRAFFYDATYQLHNGRCFDSLNEHRHRVCGGAAKDKRGCHLIGGCASEKKGGGLRLARGAAHETLPMIPTQFRGAFRAWLYRRVCYREQREVLALLDSVVQDTQGMLLQLQAVSQLIAPDSPAKAGMEATLTRAEILLAAVRDEAEVQSRRFHARSGQGRRVP